MSFGNVCKDAAPFRSIIAYIIKREIINLYHASSISAIWVGWVMNSSVMPVVNAFQEVAAVHGRCVVAAQCFSRKLCSWGECLTLIPHLPFGDLRVFHLAHKYCLCCNWREIIKFRDPCTRTVCLEANLADTHKQIRKLVLELWH
jgi:hypothetical protein